MTDWPIGQTVAKIDEILATETETLQGGCKDLTPRDMLILFDLGFLGLSHGGCTKINLKFVAFPQRWPSLRPAAIRGTRGLQPRCMTRTGLEGNCRHLAFIAVPPGLEFPDWRPGAAGHGRPAPGQLRQR